MHLIRLAFVSAAIAAVALANPPLTPPPQAIEAGKACYIYMQETSSVRASSLINGENFVLEIQIRRQDTEPRQIYQGNVIHSVAISKGQDTYYLPKEFIRLGYKTTCLFSLGKDRIGFVMQTGSGEKSSLYLYCIDTTNWHVVMEKWSYPTWIYLEAIKGVLDKVNN